MQPLLFLVMLVLLMPATAFAGCLYARKRRGRSSSIKSDLSSPRRVFPVTDEERTMRRSAALQSEPPSRRIDLAGAESAAARPPPIQPRPIPASRVSSLTEITSCSGNGVDAQSNTASEAGKRPDVALCGFEGFETAKLLVPDQENSLAYSDDAQTADLLRGYSANLTPSASEMRDHSTPGVTGELSWTTGDPSTLWQTTVKGQSGMITPSGSQLQGSPGVSGLFGSGATQFVLPAPPFDVQSGPALVELASLSGDEEPSKPRAPVHRVLVFADPARRSADAPPGSDGAAFVAATTTTDLCAEPTKGASPGRPRAVVAKRPFELGTLGTLDMEVGPHMSSNISAPLLDAHRINTPELYDVPGAQHAPSCTDSSGTVAPSCPGLEHTPGISSVLGRAVPHELKARPANPKLEDTASTFRGTYSSGGNSSGHMLESISLAEIGMTGLTQTLSTDRRTSSPPLSLPSVRSARERPTLAPALTPAPSLLCVHPVDPPPPAAASEAPRRASGPPVVVPRLNLGGVGGKLTDVTLTPSVPTGSTQRTADLRTEVLSKCVSIVSRSSSCSTRDGAEYEGTMSSVGSDDFDLRPAGQRQLARTTASDAAPDAAAAPEAPSAASSPSPRQDVQHEDRPVGAPPGRPPRRRVGAFARDAAWLALQGTPAPPPWQPPPDPTSVRDRDDHQMLESPQISGRLSPQLSGRLNSPGKWTSTAAAPAVHPFVWSSEGVRTPTLAPATADACRSPHTVGTPPCVDTVPTTRFAGPVPGFSELLSSDQVISPDSSMLEATSSALPKTDSMVIDVSLRQDVLMSASAPQQE